MASPKGLDYWRSFFRSTGSSITEVIKSGIRVAWADFPQELRTQRDQLSELLYACQQPCCCGCYGATGVEGHGSCSIRNGCDLDGVVGGNLSNDIRQRSTPTVLDKNSHLLDEVRIDDFFANHQDEPDAGAEDNGGCRTKWEDGGSFSYGHREESTQMGLEELKFATETSDDENHQPAEELRNIKMHLSNHQHEPGRKEKEVSGNYNKGVGLKSTPIVLDESKMVIENGDDESYRPREEEVRKINELLARSEHPDTILFDLLSQLHEMNVSTDILKETGIGRTVNTLRKNKSEKICNLAQTIIRDWKTSINSVLEERDRAHVAPVATNFVDPKNKDKEEAPPRGSKFEGEVEGNTKKVELAKQHQVQEKLRRGKQSSERKRNPVSPKRPQNFLPYDSVDFEVKFESTKSKIPESYQQIENVKKQKRV